jgi:hypothetical protein
MKSRVEVCGPPSSRWDERVVARMFQAPCAWLISMVASRLEAKTEWCDKIRVLSAIIEQFIAFYRDGMPVITHFPAYYRSDQAELGTNIGKWGAGVLGGAGGAGRSRAGKWVCPGRSGRAASKNARFARLGPLGPPWPTFAHIDFLDANGANEREFRHPVCAGIGLGDGVSCAA